MPRLKNAANLRRLRKKSASTRGAKSIPSSPKTPNLAKPASKIQTTYGAADRPARVGASARSTGFWEDTGGWSSGKKPRRNGIRSWTGRYSSNG